MQKVSRRDAIAAVAIAPLMMTNVVRAAARAVDSGQFVRVGGLDQWISIQGQRSAAPVLLFLHGGPGEAMSPFLDLFRPYADDFIVANWDQRGSGKTYGRYRDTTPDMEPEQFIRDTIEVSVYLRRRFAKSKIVLAGHSWGAALGLQVAKRRPDLFYGFVGCGQPVSLEKSTLSQERYARSVYSAKNDEAGLKALNEAVQLPMTDSKRRFATRKLLFGPEDQGFLSREDAYMGPKPWPTKGAVADWIGGYTFTSEVLVPKILGKDTVDLVGFDVPVPFIVVQGSDDHIAPTDVAREYVEKVNAPSKAFVEIRGGHFACYTDPQGFLGALRQQVLPLCKA
jgi:pimeloyl-ACP methyl ester carboxylesterase